MGCNRFSCRPYNNQIINMMVGRDLTNRFPPKDNEVKEVILKVENLSALHQPSLKEATFELHKGEIFRTGRTCRF